MPPRYPDGFRDQVAEYIRAHAGSPEGTFRAISVKFGISKALVGVIADEIGLADAWTDGVARTADATTARRTYLAAQRALLQEDLLDTAADLTSRLHDDVTHLHVVKTIPEGIDADPDEDGGFGFLAAERVEHTILPPGPAEWRSTMTAIAAATRAAIDLAKLDQGQDATGQATGMLEQFENSLRAARAERERLATEAADEGP
ncbi:hypothetical protein [Actinosynnema mirum]|uniref:hypothetical protein n=1 Tax=Actinosynnema mirum TaxID=40567 RepID=UPI00019AB6FF|nr:hypothetical protein [Actinosynnema mirum]